MRILYFYQYFTTPEGAWSTRCYELARRWVGEGHQVTVVTSVYDKSDLRPQGLLTRRMIDGIDVRIINVRLSNTHGSLFRLVTFAAYAVLACWYAVALRADVLIASSGPITTGLPGLVGRWLRRRPLVFEVRDLWPEGAIQLGVLRNPVAIWLTRAFERLCYRASRVVVALSEDMALAITRVAPRTAVVVVPNAADLDRFTRQDPAYERGLVVYAGTVGRMDDCGQIVEAARVLRELGRDDIRIAVLGDGMERSALMQRVRDRGLANIEFPGLRTRAEVAAWLHRATCALVTFRDVPVLGSVSPNKLFDAFAAGVPVVQTTAGWIRRLLDRERAGLSVPPGDPVAMAHAIIRLVDDPVLRSELAAGASRVARELFALDLLAKRMLGALRTAAGVVSDPAIPPTPHRV